MPHCCGVPFCIFASHGSKTDQPETTVTKDNIVQDKNSVENTVAKETIDKDENSVENTVAEDNIAKNESSVSVENTVAKDENNVQNTSSSVVLDDETFKTRVSVIM